MICSAIIPSGGTGKRFGEKIPKQYSDLNGIPVLIRTLQTIDMIDQIKSVIIPIDPEWQSFVDSKLFIFKIQKQPIFVKDGRERQDSVYNAIQTDEVKNSDIILVHDAVRPAATPQLYLNIIDAASKFDAAIPVINPKDTIKTIDENNFIDTTLPRHKLKAVQTPQGFKSKILIDAYTNAKKNNIFANDDAELVEKIGIKVKAIDGEPHNIKLTEPDDKILLQHYFEKLLE